MTAFTSKTELGLSKEDILFDYRLAVENRQASILARKEVFMGKAKFGIFGTGKEVAQIAMARYFRAGDWRSGYYRDQNVVMATGELTLKQYFAQLYAHTDIEAEPHSGGRMMIGHYATRSLDDRGHWRDLTKIKNCAPDISPTGAQMPRLVGLAYASKLYRENPALHHMTGFSHHGNEVAFGTIGNGAVAEGVFFEAINAAGVLQIPMLVSIWDDGYAISVKQEYQTTKVDIAALFEGFRRNGNERGIEVIKAKGWDYEELCYAYREGARIAREEHVPVLLHVYELTQPMGHSTSGSHERYKSKERLDWEEVYDCNVQFRKWILERGIANELELESIEAQAIEVVRQARKEAWEEYASSLLSDQKEAESLMQSAIEEASYLSGELTSLVAALHSNPNPGRAEVVRMVKKSLRLLRNENPDRIEAINGMKRWVHRITKENKLRYNSLQYSESDFSPLNVPVIAPQYQEDGPIVDGREVIMHNFDAWFHKDPRIIAFGEDVGQIGDVNQGFAGLQAKHGEQRITDTGIREATIVGQAIGLAMRGLKPIAEIQYLDYIYYAIQILSDDVASMRYRSCGGQQAPLIIRTRGHRLEGMFHSGSPMQMILGAIRGMHLCVPRNMTQAAGMYNTLLRGDDPAIVIETLNAYRLKEKLPANLADFTLALGVPEVLCEGQDITIVTYGAMVRICLEAAEELHALGIACEVIDIQTLLPFDRGALIAESLRKTNRVVFADEDVSGGATAYMMQQVLDKDGGYAFLDSAPRCLSAQDHRPPYGSDGDYFTKPNVENVIDVVYQLMNEVNPSAYPSLY